jgi:hypothetical protein
MFLSPIFCYLPALRPKYLPQHPTLHHPRPISFPWYDTVVLTPTWNKR